MAPLNKRDEYHFLNSSIQMAPGSAGQITTASGGPCGDDTVGSKYPTPGSSHSACLAAVTSGNAGLMTRSLTSTQSVRKMRERSTRKDWLSA